MLLAACGASDKSPSPSAAGESEKAEQHAEAEERGGLKLTQEDIERAGIRIETLQMQTLADTLTVTATVSANLDRVARIAPRVEGRLIGVTAKLGDMVRAGQALAILDSLALGEAQAALLQAQTNQRVAQADFKRAQALSADEIIPQRDYLRAQADFEKASTELRAAQDRLRLLGVTPSAGAAHAQSSFAVVAPFAGTVIQKKATLGDLASPSDALFTVADLSTVWIEASLPEAVLAKVRTGATASVTVTAYAGERFSGRVAYVASVLDKDTRTAAARIEVVNRDGRLKPEMFASAIIETGGGGRQALSVPDDAIVLLQGQPTLFVQEHGGFESRAVELSDKLGGRTVIKSGVKAGEQIVAAGAYALKARLLKSQISDEH
jgi:cobalt-zinc-cadmium efflux system membrane fusion protein